MIRTATLLALIAWGGGVRAAHAQAPIVVRLADAGLGTGPAILARALAEPHVTIAPSPTPATLRRDSSYNETVVVLGRDVIVEGAVRGDVIVVGGDLYMHPGGRISGRAVAIGGGVYESTLARIGGGILTFRDIAYDITPADGAYVLSYREIVARDSTAFSLPGVYGFSIPTYDRSNGLSLGFGPRLTLRGTGFSLEPRVTYRSQLGAIDLGVSARDSVNRQTAVSVTGTQGTFTNDAWIWSDLLNSTEFLLFGHDSRNYFRGERAELSLGRRLDGADRTIVGSVTGRVERMHSVRPDSLLVTDGLFHHVPPTGGPFTFYGRHDTDDRLRPNPQMTQTGTIASGIGTLDVIWEANTLTAGLRADAEIGRFWPSERFIPPATAGLPQSDFAALNSNRNFGQLTVDGNVSFATFGSQLLSVSGHAVATTHGLTPRQRYAYVGGPGTIPTLELLELGGDQLLYLDFRYSIPLERLTLPVVGPPTLMLRHAMGSAGVGGLPALEQATGFRLIVSILYGELLVDPATGHTHRTFGLSLAR